MNSDVEITKTVEICSALKFCFSNYYALNGMDRLFFYTCLFSRVREMKGTVNLDCRD